jgi:uncharacterized protein YciI
MKVMLVFAVLMLTTIRLHAQTDDSNTVKFTGPDGKEMVMRRYFVAFLIRGDNRDHPQEEALDIQNKHIEYLTSLWERGIILLNGPFDEAGELRGMSLYQVESADKAKEYAENDPAVKAGRLKIEIHPWWSAPFIPQF